MGLIGRARATGRALSAARAASQREATYVRAFAAFCNAGSVEQRADAVQAFMLTSEYDGWLAAYLRRVWENDEEQAVWGQHQRFALRYLSETESYDALTELDAELPTAWQERLEPLEPTREPGRRPEELERFSRSVERLLQQPEGLTAFQQSELHRMVADSYAERWDAVDGTSMIDAALEHYDRALDLSPPFGGLLARGFGWAAAMHNKRFDVTQSLRSIDLTIEYAELAISAALPGQLELADFHGVWGAGLRNAAALTEDSLYWEATASAFSQAAALSRTSDPRRTFFVSSAGMGEHNARLAPLHARLPRGVNGSNIVEMERAMLLEPELRERFTIIPKNAQELDEGDVPRDLDQLIAAEQTRLDIEQPGSAGARGTGISVGRLLFDRYRSTADPEDLDRAGVLSAEGLGATRPDDLISAYALRADVLEAQQRPDVEITDVLVRGMHVAARYPNPDGIRLAKQLAERASVTARWGLAATAYDTAVSIHARLVQRQVGRDHQDRALTWGPALGMSAALAHARAGDPQAAAESLESGRAQLISMSLRRDAADVDLLRDSGHEELADAYASALLRLAAATREEDPEVATERAQEDLDRAVTAIRVLDGWSDFLRPLRAADMQRVAREAGVSVLFVAEADPDGLVVLVGETVQAVLVPDLTHQSAREHLAPLGRTPGTAGHTAGVEAACRWLGDTLEPVLAQLPMTERVVIVPCGMLTMAPLHAARTSGGRYLFDDVEVRLAANVEAVRASTARAGGDLSRAVVVADPSGEAQGELPYASFEAGFVAAALSGLGSAVTTLHGPAATPEAVHTELGRTDLVHVACHAVAEPDHPLRSGLVLADGERLTMEDIEGGRLAARLVVLSACESATTDQRLPDEAVSLPTSLIASGCAAVIGSLWKVDDQATTIMMMETYDAISRGIPAVRALLQAQRHLREATNAELLARVRALGQRSGQPGFRRLVSSLALADPEARDFTSPARWAAFTYVGA